MPARAALASRRSPVTAGGHCWRDSAGGSVPGRAASAGGSARRSLLAGCPYESAPIRAAVTVRWNGARPAAPSSLVRGQQRDMRTRCPSASWPDRAPRSGSGCLGQTVLARLCCRLQLCTCRGGETHYRQIRPGALTSRPCGPPGIGDRESAHRNPERLPCRFPRHLAPDPPSSPGSAPPAVFSLRTRRSCSSPRHRRLRSSPPWWTGALPACPSNTFSAGRSSAACG